MRAEHAQMVSVYTATGATQRKYYYYCYWTNSNKFIQYQILVGCIVLVIREYSLGIISG